MKNSWWNNKFRKVISHQCKCFLVPTLFIVSVVVLVSYFAATYVQAAEGKQAKRMFIDKIKDTDDAQVNS
ncbi:hypothetical protein JST56_06505 [Candidatus Dependentiae bacterium]|jgi:hypothetical protein|nr:hypothetical protein [Candidatus Dependentiae bacterium]